MFLIFFGEVKIIKDPAVFSKKYDQFLIDS